MSKRFLTKEHKEKIGLANKGNIPWSKGKKLTKKTKTKQSQGKKGNKNPMFGKIPWNKGKKGPEVSGSKSPAWKGGRPKCLDCGKNITYGFKRCHKCAGLVMMGINSPHWKGGITTENNRVRTSAEMKLWKKACMERDNFTCQKTGQRGGKLQVHHINNFADFPELRTSIENGITLSKESHELFHKIYGKRNNTKEQLLEFLKN